MRQITITLSDEVAEMLELRAAIDDLRVEKGIEHFLTELAQPLLEKRRNKGTP